MKPVYFLFTILLLASCNSSRDFIIPFDYEANFPDTKNGLTQEQGNEYNRYAMNQLQLNTVGKKLPNIVIYDLNDKKVRLDKLIKQTTLLYATDNHCGWGLEVLDTDLPYTLEKLKKDSISINTIALLIMTPEDSTDLEDFMKEAREVSTIYNHFYIIAESEAAKFNALNATQVLIDKHKTVLHLGYGANSDPEIYYQRLKSKLQAIGSAAQ